MPTYKIGSEPHIITCVEDDEFVIAIYRPGLATTGDKPSASMANLVRWLLNLGSAEQAQTAAEEAKPAVVRLDYIEGEVDGSDALDLTIRIDKFEGEAAGPGMYGLFSVPKAVKQLKVGDRVRIVIEVTGVAP